MQNSIPIGYLVYGITFLLKKNIILSLQKTLCCYAVSCRSLLPISIYVRGLAMFSIGNMILTIRQDHLDSQNRIK